jgi:hypothetical protein
MGRIKGKDPTKQVPMRLPESLVAKINTATASFGRKTSRTAVVIRLINDGFKWWAREDLEQDTTLQMVNQMHERTATILAMQNVMAQRMGFLDTKAKADQFSADVQKRKREILKLGGGVAGYGLATASIGSGGSVSDDDDGDDGELDESDVDGDDDDDS